MRLLRSPVALALLLTLLNAPKPAAVDDGAYLLFARHLAQHPSDPYGWELFWYRHPEPAFRVLLPPVVPYSLAAGVALCGDHLGLVKLSLLPFGLALAFAARSLLHRFAPDHAEALLPAFVLGPAALPMLGAMLDVPAVALGLSAVALFLRGGWGNAVAAGLCAGLAIQAKYSLLVAPAALVWCGLLTRRLPASLLAALVAAALFAAWEATVAAKYGDSHFLFHLRDQGDYVTRTPEEGGKLLAAVRLKLRLFQPMLGHLGWVGIPAGLASAAALGFGRRVVAALAVAAGVGFAAVVLWPGGNVAVGVGRMDLSTAVFVTLGSVWGGLTLACAVDLLRRRDRAGVLLAGWLLLELAAYFALTPFPATRRVLGVAAAGLLVAARLLSVGGRTLPNLVPVAAVAAGVALFALDAWDALPEKAISDGAAEVVAAHGGGRVWFQGHWGWQYYGERRGWRLVVPGETAVEAGDLLVLPVIPDDVGFYRPYHGQALFDVPPDGVLELATLTWDDPIRGTTIPTLYGGEVPVRGRNHPRMRVRVVRATRPWTAYPPR